MYFNFLFMALLGVFPLKPRVLKLRDREMLKFPNELSNLAHVTIIKLCAIGLSPVAA